MLSGVLGVSHPGERTTGWKGCLHLTSLKNEAANIAHASPALGVYTFTLAMNQRIEDAGFCYVSQTNMSKNVGHDIFGTLFREFS